MRIQFTWLLFLAVTAATPVMAEETFRTDASEDETLAWYQTVPGEFPPEGSAHYYTGELVGKDHIHRTGTIRVSRTDKQRRSHRDLPVDFRMLPYGSIAYHGSPAALKDIPIGTHLHGMWYVKDEGEETKSLFYNRKSIEADFVKAFRLVDDFTFYQERNQLWQVDKVDLQEMKLGLVSQAEGEEKPTTIELDLTPATKIYLGKQFATLQDIQPGQNVLFNLTWATLYGAGRCTELWLDEESRQIATDHQLAQHRLHQKDRGLAGIIDAVDNQKRILTVTLFGGVDSTLLDDITPNKSAHVCVAEPTLQIYDQVNDKKGGPILSVDQIEKQPGSSGIQLQVQPSLLLEGYRPGRIVRIFPSGWSIVALPEEETLWPERD